MHQKRSGRNLIAAVFVGQSGGLFDGGEMFGGGRCVNVTHLYTWGGWGLDIALSCERGKTYVANENIPQENWITICMLELISSVLTFK